MSHIGTSSASSISSVLKNSTNSVSVVEAIEKLWVVPEDVATVLHVWVVVVRDLDAGGICLPRHVVYVEVVLALKVVHG